MYNKNSTYSYVLEFIKSNNLKHEIHKFSSGALMIDLWKGDEFYVLQIEKETIGFSVINDDPEFSTVPDKSYSDFRGFKDDFEKILLSQTPPSLSEE